MKNEWFTTPHTKLGKRRWELYCEDQHCHYCKRFLYWRETTVDHVKPVSKGGSDDLTNLVLSCQSCNQNKADDYDEDQ